MSDGNNPRIRVAAVVVKNGRILLVEHTKNGRKYWLIPGGGLERGETLFACAEREVFEETGVRINAGDAVFLSEYISGSSGRHVVHVILKGEYISGEVSPGCDGILTDAAFVDIEKAGTLEIMPDLGGRLEKYLSGERAAGIYTGADR